MRNNYTCIVVKSHNVRVTQEFLLLKGNVLHHLWGTATGKNTIPPLNTEIYNYKVNYPRHH